MMRTAFLSSRNLFTAGLSVIALALGAQLVVVARAVDAQAADAKKPVTATVAPKPATATPASAATADAPPSSVPESRSEMSLLNELAKRRATIEARQKQSELKDQVLAASEKRVDAKLAELKAAEDRIKAMDAAQDARRNEEFAALVKVYETMKPKDAARIFQRLDMPVQVAVGSRMKPAKIAAVMAQMDSEAAKLLTMSLAQRARVAANAGQGG